MLRVQLHDIVAGASTLRGDSLALTYKDSSLTYRELWEEVAQIAAGLRHLGLERRGRVAVYLEKRPETVAAIFATSAAGGVVVPVNPLLRSHQVGYILGDCDAQVLITSIERLAGLREELRALPDLHQVVVGGEAFSSPETDRFTRWETLHMAPSHDVGYGSGAVDTDIAAILYTSGSTGSPKGVVLSHRNLIVGAESVSHYLGNNPDDVILAALPLSFDAGLSQLTTGFLSGAHVVIMNYLLPTDVARLCARHQVTGLTCVPPLWMQLVEHDWPSEATLSMRYFASTGGRMPKATLAKLRTLFPRAAPFLMYGLTEAFRSTYLDPSEVDRRPDSIGKAIPNTEVVVVRPDGTLCEPGEEGELVHRGPLVSLGYWNDLERTADRFRPAPGQAPGIHTEELAVWSGDRVVQDEEGFLYFVGRLDEMIKTSGYRVSPTEVEEAAYETGLVGESVAVGIPNEQLGQHIALVASPAEGGDLVPEELLEEMRRWLPPYMVPRRVVVRKDLPRSPNGKIDRVLLRRELDGEEAS